MEVYSMFEAQENKNEERKFSITRYIKVYLDDTDPNNTKTKTVFSKKPFSPEQFTQIFMGILESYTAALLETNSKEQIFEHFNNAFGIFLNKLLPADEIYEKSESHKAFKDVVDETLGAENTEEVQRETEDNRLAAYILCRDVLTKEIGLTEESADLILNRRLGLLQSPVEKTEESVEKSDESTTE